MPPRLSPPSAGEVLTDTWGRNNRRLADRQCPNCGKTFRPPKRAARYCSRPCSWANNGGHNRTDGPVWWVDQKGYTVGRVWSGGKRVFVRQHRWVMELHLGRPLAKHEDVHHLNADKADNRIENLRLVTHGEHSVITNAERSYVRGYKLNLTPAQRAERSERAKRMRLGDIGRAAKAARG